MSFSFAFQQQRLLQGQAATTRSSKASGGKTTTTTPKAFDLSTANSGSPFGTVRNEILGSSSSFSELLNSFQTEPTSTRRPQLTTFSDADDIAFLNGLVRLNGLRLENSAAAQPQPHTPLANGPLNKYALFIYIQI